MPKKKKIKTKRSHCTASTTCAVGSGPSSSSSSSKSVLPTSLICSPISKTSHYSNPSTSTSTSTSTNVQALVPSAVFVSKNFFTLDECQTLVQHAEQNIGFEHMNNPKTREYAHRTCGRIQVNDCYDFANILFERMKPIMNDITNQLQFSSNQNDGDYHYQPVGCNPNIRIYKYEKKMSFGRHYDGSNRISLDGFSDCGSGVGVRVGNTEITVLIYLSSCQGGATRFYLPHGGRSSTCKKHKKNKKKREILKDNYDSDDDGDGDDGSVAFTPQAGAILLHTHGDRCLEHKAEPVVKGLKYILRTDIVYARRISTRND